MIFFLYHVFRMTGYYVTWCSFLYISLPGPFQAFWICTFIGSSNLQTFGQYFFKYLSGLLPFFWNSSYIHTFLVFLPHFHWKRYLQYEYPISPISPYISNISNMKRYLQYLLFPCTTFVIIFLIHFLLYHFSFQWTLFSN